MPQNTKKPQLRFKGFADNWEQRKLGEVAVSFEYGLNVAAKKFDGKRKYIRITDIDGDTRLFLETDLTSPDIDLDNLNNYQLKEGDILFARTGASVGRTYIYRDSDGLVYYAGFLIRARIKNEFSAGFIFYNTLTSNYEVFIRITAQRSGQPGVNAQEYYEYKLSIPNYKEQIKIASFFYKIDNLITLQQRKLGKLKNIKKSMLEKMFPKTGSNVPEIRFKGFTDDWEQRKLSEVAEKTFGGGTPTTSNYEYWHGNIPWIQSSDVIDGNLIDVIPKKYITQKGLNSSAARLVPKNSIAIITRVGVGKLAFMSFCYTTSQDFLSLSNLNAEPLFTTYSCYKKLQYDLNKVQGTSIKGITKDELLRKIIWIPKYKEQMKISKFLYKLDNLITLHQRKLEKLQNIKKACLEKMFV